MANAGAKFDTETPMMSEGEAGPIDMSSAEEMAASEPGPVMDMDEPAPHQTEIRFDDTGAMVEEPEPDLQDPAALINVLEESPPEEIKLKEPSEDASPEYMRTLAESQQQMADYMRHQQEQQSKEAEIQRLQKEQQEQAYYSSAEYITELCEKSGLDAEDAVHRQLIETRLDLHRQNQSYGQRMKQLEQQFQNQQYAQHQHRQEQNLVSSFEEAAAQYSGATDEMVAAARSQATLLVQNGLSPERAIAESMKFVRLSANQTPTSKTSRATSKRQARLDQLNSAGPGRGAKSHRKPDGMSMAEADTLVSRGGFFPN